jgi:uncharacterized protein YvpB
MNLLPVPLREQRQPADCLPACVAMVLDFLGQPSDYASLLRALGTAPYGTVASRVTRLAHTNLAVHYREGSLADLQIWIDHGLPVIVLVKTSELPYWTYSTLHSIVLVGYDTADVYANDPHFVDAPIKIPLGDFELAWLEMGNRYIVFEPIAL